MVFGALKSPGRTDRSGDSRASRSGTRNRLPVLNLGAGFAQLQLMKRSKATSLAPEVRADREALAAAIVTKIELPAIFGSIASGIGFIAQNPSVLKFGWLHAKLMVVLLLAGLSQHLPEVVHHLTPDGRLPTENELSRLL